MRIEDLYTESNRCVASACAPNPTALICCSMSKRLTDAVRAAITAAPCSIRRLAQMAGVPAPTLWRISKRELGASPDVADAVAIALERWSQDCAKAAERIRKVER